MIVQKIRLKYECRLVKVFEVFGEDTSTASFLTKRID